MALELVKARARTRGKSPVEFSYEGVGKIETRKVTDKEGNAIVVDAEGKQIDYAGTVAEGETYTLPSGARYVEVDDLVTAGLTDDIEQVIELFGSVKSDVSPLQRVIDGALAYYNIQARKAASPVQEVVTEDELTPIIAEMVAKGVLAEKDVTTWRRVVTQASKQVEMERIDYVKMTKEFKALKNKS